MKWRGFVAAALMAALCISGYAQEKKQAAPAEKPAQQKPAEKPQKEGPTIVNGLDMMVDGLGGLLKGTGRIVYGTGELAVKIVLAPFQFIGEQFCGKKKAEAAKPAGAPAKAEPLKKQGAAEPPKTSK